MELVQCCNFVNFLAYPAISAYVSNYADEDKQGLVQGIITGVRCLCTGLGPAVFGLVFSLFDLDLNHQTDDEISYLEKSRHSMSPLGVLGAPNITTNMNLINKMFNSSKVILDLHNTQMVPGPPFLFGALLVLIAILVTAFIPELIHYPESGSGINGTGNGGGYGQDGNKLGSSIGRSTTIMSPSRSNNTSYYYKNMHHIVSHEADCCAEEELHFEKVSLVSPREHRDRVLNNSNDNILSNCGEHTTTEDEEPDEKEKLLVSFAYHKSNPKFGVGSSSEEMIERRRRNSFNSDEEKKTTVNNKDYNIVYHPNSRPYLKPLETKS